MSTQIINANGRTVATKFFGGKDRGLCLDVFLPKNLMKDVGGMIVGEGPTAMIKLTLADYITEIENRGGTAIYREPGVHGASTKVGFFKRA